MKRPFHLLIFCVGVLMVLGLVTLYSSSMAHHGAGYLSSQLKWGIAGAVVCFALASIDYRLLKKYNLPFIAAGGAIVLLGLVLVPGIGKEVNGAQRWFKIGGQPSELAKIALILVLAWWGDRNQRHAQTFVRGLVVPGTLIGVMFVLIFLEPDWGTALLIAAVGGVMMLASGVRWAYFVPPIVIGCIAVAFLLANNEVRRNRVLAFLHPEETKNDVGYQPYQAKLALGSGGWTGKGLGNGRLKHGFVPEHHTDFILSVVGEELGLVATLGVLGGFIMVVLCGTSVARRAPDVFGKLLATGITFLIGLQAFINIGVVTGALPNKGISLPFVSYGGSGLLVMLSAAGLLFSVARITADISPAEQKMMDDENLFAAQCA